MAFRRDGQAFGSKFVRPVVVSYDEAARKDYLTGFRARKMERRATAAAEAADLAKAARLAARKERADEIAALMPPSVVEYADGPEVGRPTTSADGVDEFSRARFGAASVRVTTSFGVGGAAAEVDEEEAALIALAARVGGIKPAAGGSRWGGNNNAGGGGGGDKPRSLKKKQHSGGKGPRVLGGVKADPRHKKERIKAYKKARQVKKSKRRK